MLLAMVAAGSEAPGTMLRSWTSANSLLAQGPEARANLFREDLGLFPGCEVATLVDLVVVDELGICLLRPTPRERIELVREDTHGNRDSHPLTPKNPFLFSQ